MTLSVKTTKSESSVLSYQNLHPNLSLKGLTFQEWIKIQNKPKPKKWTQVQKWTKIQKKP